MSNTAKKDQNGIDRRRFISAVGLGAGAAGAAAVMASSGGAEAASLESGEAKSTGYHETDHVRRAYEVAKF
ncbi:MAG: twin-arginine translocation signal domain-containing protein [Alphaproteobacteria bacterium]